MAGDRSSSEDAAQTSAGPTSPSLRARLAAPTPQPATTSLRARLANRQRPWWSAVWHNKTQRWTAIGVAAMFLLTFVAGVAYFWAGQDDQRHDYVEVYITDLPANFTKLEVRLAGVYVGEPNYTLQLLAPRFDLLSLRGPDDALKVAAGNVPAADHQAVRIVFHSARASLNGAWVTLDMPDQMLTIRHDFTSEKDPSSAFLFDIDVEDSIQVEGARLVFRPHVDAIYHHSFTTGAVQQLTAGPKEGAPPPQPEFKNESKTAPRQQELGKPEGQLRSNPGASSATTTNSKINWKAGDPTPSFSSTTSRSSTSSTTSDAGPVTAPATDTSGYLPEPGEANSVPNDPREIGGWFVQFKPTLQLVPDMINAIRASYKGEPDAPPELVFTFATEAAAYVFATPEQAWEMSMHPDILYVEPDQEVVFNLATSRSAVRLPQVHDLLQGLKDSQGRPLDGTGVSVAAIDIGFDGTHPDLPHRLVNGVDPLLLANFKVESIFTVDAPNTDLTSGHGTHVLGILGGRGVLDPTQRGVAPNIDVYGFAIGEGSTTLWPNTALDWLVQNHDQVDPPIKLVTNSWGSGSTYDPRSLTTRLIERLIDEGVTVVFSAGNAGGDGSIAATTSQCQIPKPGLICVGAFNDHNSGTRDGTIAPYSSRGRIADPTTWPDVVAPGTSIRSAKPMLGAVTGLNPLTSYTELSGTSMAAPHVAGIVALMLQANPNLRPAQVEAMLEGSAYKFGDGGAYGANGHHAKGHGLVDAYAAISLANQG